MPHPISPVIFLSPIVIKAKQIKEKTIPKVGRFLLEIFAIYLLLTFICTILYFIAGMTKFDAIAHAMTTIATGDAPQFLQSL